VDNTPIKSMKKRDWKQVDGVVVIFFPPEEQKKCGTQHRRNCGGNSTNIERTGPKGGRVFMRKGWLEGLSHNRIT